MKRVLVIGAGNFGCHLIGALREQGCEVDVVDKEAGPQYALRNLGCRCVVNNVWNLPAVPGVQPADYDCCYLCIAPGLPVNLHAVQGLRRGGARRIVVRVKSAEEIPALSAAGADRVICPAQLAGRTLAQELAE